LRLGLATLRIPEICGRVCDYYVVLEKSSRALSFLVSALLLAHLLCLGGLLGLSWSQLQGWSMALPSLGGLAGILLVLAVAALAATHLAGWLLQQWSSPDSLLWRLLAQFRQGQSCLVARSLYQYLLNLGLCVQSNFAIERSATLCARAESVIWIRGVYLEIADALKGGAVLSLAFRNSGLLALTSIGPLPPRSVNGGVNQLWSPGITDVVKLSFQQQLGHMLRYVAAMLFLISILILWVAVKLVSGL
jgi:general secretion pathway protein F